MPIPNQAREVASDADMMILHVVSPRAAAEATPAEGAAAEPEVIKKGKPEKDAK